MYGSLLWLSARSLLSGMVIGSARFSVMSRSCGACDDAMATLESRCAASSWLTLMTVRRRSLVERRIMSTTVPCFSPSALSPFLHTEKRAQTGMYSRNNRRGDKPRSIEMKIRVLAKGDGAAAPPPPPFPPTLFAPPPPPVKRCTLPIFRFLCFFMPFNENAVDSQY